MSKQGQRIDWDEVKGRLSRSQLALERALAPDPERTAAIFRARADQLARRRGRAEARPDALRVLTFMLGTERYGLDFADVAQLLPFAGCTPLPGAPALLLGAINIHGEIRSVVDLARLLGLPDPAPPDGGYVLVIHRRDRAAALRVDAVEAIRFLAARDVTVPSRPDGDAAASYLRGLAPDNLRLLCTEAILGHPVILGGVS